MSGCIARCARNAQAQLLWKSARAPFVPRLLLKSADTLHSLGLILKTQQFIEKRTFSSFLFGTAKMEPKVRIFQIIFEMWNFMIVWGITNSGEFLLNPPQLSRRFNRYSIRRHISFKHFARLLPQQCLPQNIFKLFFLQYLCAWILSRWADICKVKDIELTL